MYIDGKFVSKVDPRSERNKLYNIGIPVKREELDIYGDFELKKPLGLHGLHKHI